MIEDKILGKLDVIDILASSVMDSGRSGSDEAMYVQLIKRDTKQIRLLLDDLSNDDFSIERIIQELNSWVSVDDQREFALELINELMNKYAFTLGVLPYNPEY